MKLKLLKGKIKGWVALHFGDVSAIKESILEEIRLLDKEEERGPLADTNFNRRVALKDEFMRKVREEEIKCKQRS